MRNIRILIQYDGYNYKGWQRLGDNDNTIQNVIEKVLKGILKEDIELIGSGRTDKGVNAENQVANFVTNSNISPKKILEQCNKQLPRDIVIKECTEVSLNFHSRYNAVKKIYTYRIWNSDILDVFKRKYYCHIKEELNIEDMKKGAAFLIGEHDFKSYTAMKSKKKSTVRTIYSIDITKNKEEVIITITGNGFLYKMVRTIVGTLIKVGLNKLSPKDVLEILEKKDRRFASETASPNALFLTKVIYN